MAMVSSRLVFLFSICILISQAFAQQPLRHFCLDNGNYTSNSTYKANLNQLLSSLSSSTEIDYGFYNFSYGQYPNKVYSIGLCRRDVIPYNCRSCLNNATNLLPQFCPNQKEAIVWYEGYMLRYLFRDIFNIKETSPPFCEYNNINVSANYVVLHRQGAPGKEVYLFAKDAGNRLKVGRRVSVADLIIFCS